ncbi:MAG: hypothetical protein DRJ07_02315 [Bacteroidetes bacterium]|nr:MAG: hypothetical protein DRJ07_02315 [Bacteroidota bacterium]
MKKSIILSLGILIALSSCKSTKITSDFDPNTNFTEYKTYFVLPWHEENATSINPFDQKRILNAIHDQMQSRGYKRVESGSDLAISTFMLLNDKEQTSAYLNYYSTNGYGYYGGFGYHSFGTGYGTVGFATMRSELYTVGTLIIDIFDNKTKKLIWQGIGEGSLKSEEKKREKNTPKVIGDMMKSYPVKPKKE